MLLALSWKLAAFGEELAYRGYVKTRLRDILPAGTLGLGIAVVLSSVLFGLAHTDQGLIGVALTTLDAVFFSVLRYRYAPCGRDPRARLQQHHRSDRVLHRRTVLRTLVAARGTARTRRAAPPVRRPAVD